MRIPEAPGRGIAVALRYVLVKSGLRPFVGHGSVWCDDEWWPFTASAVGLFTLRARFGVRALCITPADRCAHLRPRP